MSDRRKFVPFIVPLMFGVISLSNSLANPRIAARLAIGAK